MKTFLKILGCIIILLALKALTDAMQFKEIKVIEHLLKWVLMGYIFVLGIAIKDHLFYNSWLKLGLIVFATAFLSYGIFDLLFNLFAGLEFGYIGFTDLIDRFKLVFRANLPVWFSLSRYLSIFFGMICINEFRKL